MDLLNKIYHSKYFPRFFYVKPDGGNDSGVTAYFLIEWKILFSIGVLKFNTGSREAYHSHAFNALTWWICGDADERRLSNQNSVRYNITKQYERSWKPKYTPRDNIHKVVAFTKSWAFTLRGPWKETWLEYKNGVETTLTHGRKVIE